MNTLFNFPKDLFKPGMELSGKWNKKSYVIIRYIGHGENGSVFLVESSGKQYALKITEHSFDLSYEIKMIQQLSLTQGNHLGFSVFDIDDFVFGEEIYPYYVMPYRTGITIEQYLTGMRQADYLYLFSIIVNRLEMLHREGIVFGDLKGEHIIVDPITLEISLIDYGGLSLFNESVRQYTVLYDRASWRMGDRRANPHYDFFSLTLIFIKIAIGENKFKRIFQQSRHVKELYDIIPNINSLKLLAPVLMKILTGKRVSAKIIKRELETIRIKSLSDSKRVKWKWIEWVFSLSFFVFIMMFLRLLYAL